MPKFSLQGRMLIIENLRAPGLIIPCFRSSNLPILLVRKSNGQECRFDQDIKVADHMAGGWCWSLLRIWAETADWNIMVFLCVVFPSWLGFIQHNSCLSRGVFQVLQ